MFRAAYSCTMITRTSRGVRAPDGTALLRPGEVGVELRLSRATIYRMIAKGELERVNVGEGQAIRVTRRSVDAYIQAKTIRSQAEAS